MHKEEVSTNQAPAAIGPYSQAIKAGNMVFASGQIPIHPSTGELVGGGIEEQTKQVLENVKALLEASGSSLSQVIKTTVFLKDMNTFSDMNKIYSQYFSAPYPARSTIEVARLPKDVAVEIEVIAMV